MSEFKDRETRLEAAVKGLLAIVDDSRGVAGYHLNGDVAEWDEFEEVDAARAALGTASVSNQLPAGQHIYAGSCPDEIQPDARDSNCPACIDMVAASLKPDDGERYRFLCEEMVANGAGSQLLHNLAFVAWSANKETVDLNLDEAMAKQGMLAAAKEQGVAPLATVEARYRDLLNRLGVNGHDGAIAEIEGLREKAGLTKRHPDLCQCNETGKTGPWCEGCPR